MPAGDETLLVGLDRQANDFRRDRQVILFEGAHQHLRPLHQAGHFFQQALVLDQFQAVGKGDIAGIVQDDVLAALGIENDLGLIQAGHVIVETLDGDRACRVEPMAIGHVRGDDAIDLEGDDDSLLMLGAEGADDRLQRPHPA